MISQPGPLLDRRKTGSPRTAAPPVLPALRSSTGNAGTHAAGLSTRLTDLARDLGMAAHPSPKSQPRAQSHGLVAARQGKQAASPTQGTEIRRVARALDDLEVQEQPLLRQRKPLTPYTSRYDQVRGPLLGTSRGNWQLGLG